ncbi:MAG TPA: hypothetical protein EYG79_10090 [Rhodobacteraceae bacterium]|nr:hypothetical protein [Paracoccaceae bacterium]
MTTIRIHPSELAYAFSYSETVDIVGWGRDPFLPTTEADGDPKRWYADGAARLSAAGRLTETPEKGLNFSDEMTAAVLTLVDPALVLLAQRKEGDGMRRLTVHMAKDTVLGMTRHPDGMFELTHYADLTAATLACVGFLGAARSPVRAGARIDSNQEALAEVHQLATKGHADQAIARLVTLGASAHDAASIQRAMSAPATAGMLSILYCANNVARTARPFSIMTTAEDETWILFPPASLEGPMVIEQSSVSALTARVLVEIAAWHKISA